MDPVSALVIACVAAWAMTRGAVDAAASQAAQEARAAADAIREDLRGRSEAWARTLADRIADGRKGGPATGMWWVWAAARTGRAVRDALRREPRQAERARQVRGTTGPWRRIWDAGVNGARFAREQARQRRQAPEQPTQVRLGVCEQCGAVVARDSLQTATVGPARRTLRVCVGCRAAEADRATQTTDPAGDTRPESQQGDTVDADIVPDQPERDRRPDVDGTRPRIDPHHGDEPTEGPDPAAPSSPDPKPAQRAPWPEPRPATPVPAPPRRPTPADEAPPIEQGEPMAPRAPGQLVPRHGNRVATHAARGNGGESYTHGQWNRAVTDIEKRLAELPAVLEMMLHRLTTADAGRTQVTGTVALNDRIVLFMKQVQEMLTEVNRREHPVLRAVEDAGGPDEIASISYLREV